jgi:hypothetical protein
MYELKFYVLCRKFCFIKKYKLELFPQNNNNRLVLVTET